MGRRCHIREKERKEKKKKKKKKRNKKEKEKKYLLMYPLRVISRYVTLYLKIQIYLEATATEYLYMYAK